jgi:hypothetical protein
MNQNRFRTLLGALAANKSLAFLAEGRIVSITDQNTLAVIGPGDPQGRELEALNGQPLNVVASSDGGLLAAGIATGTIGLWDGATGAAKPAIRTGSLATIEAAQSFARPINRASAASSPGACGSG